MKKRIISTIKKHWVLMVFLGIYLAGRFYGFSGVGSSLFGMVVLILILIQKEIRREKFERCVDQASSNLNHKRGLWYKKTLLFSVAGALVLLGVYVLGISNGRGVSQSLSEQRLDDLQKSIYNQSGKIDDLQKENTDEPDVSTPTGIQAIIQSSIDKTDRENKEKCQRELSEYNSCLAEYNSKMVEYSSCLAEEANPSFWNYGNTSLCFKPSNYCFKPSCAY